VADGKVTVQGEFNYQDIEKGLARIEGKIDSFARENQQVSAASTKASQGVLDTARSVQALTAAIASSQVLKLTADLTQLGAISDQAEWALDRLTDGQADLYLERVGEAAGHTVDDMALMTATNRALRLGVIDTSEEMAQLTEVARVMGQTMGITTEQALDNMVTAIGRESKLIADNLGVIVDMNAVQEESAQLMQQNAGMTEQAARKQAFFNEFMRQGEQVIAQTGGAYNGAASEIEYYTAQVENLKQDAGETLTGIFAWTQGTRALREAVHDQRLEIAAASKDYEDFRGQIWGLNHDLGPLGQMFLNFGDMGATRKQFETLRAEAEQMQLEVFNTDMAQGFQAMLESVQGGDMTIPAPSPDEAIAAYEEAMFAAQAYYDAVQQQAGLELGIVQAIPGIEGMSDLFSMNMQMLGAYNLTADETLRIYQDLGLASGQVTEAQILQAEAARETMNLYMAGYLSGQELINTQMQLASASDTAAASQQAQTETARNFAQEAGISAQVAQQAMENAASGLPASFEEVNAQVQEAIDLLEGIPPTVETEVRAQVEQAISDLQETEDALQTVQKPRVVKISSTAPAATGEVNALDKAVRGLPSSKTITIKIKTQGSVPKFAGGADFVTQGPMLALLGDNPGGREHVRVTPLSGRGRSTPIPGGVAMAGGGEALAGAGAGSTILQWSGNLILQGVSDAEAFARDFWPAMEREARLNGKQLAVAS